VKKRVGMIELDKHFQITKLVTGYEEKIDEREESS